MEVSNFVGENVKRLGYLFYIMDPRMHNYEKIDDVKDYYKEVTPLFFITVLLEQIIRYHQRKHLWTYNITISNVCHGVLYELSKIPFRGAEVFVYAWVYNNYRVVTLPWNSAWTWILAWLGTDFCYYWMHRMIHQVNVLWAIHETHHTPEDMMFTAPMRNHIFLLPIHWLTYIPLALALPPTAFLVHYQISIIYQYWLHSEIIYKLPAFIEYLFCTPSHHRAHHGRNRRYIDKNFGGFLIIWDRIFGTYEDEDEDEKPLYGTTSQMKSLNPFVIETSHFITIWKKFWQSEGWEHKLSVLFKGPGWSPGKSWTGDINDIPHPAPIYEKFCPKLPKWCEIYMKTHFSIFLVAYLAMGLNLGMLSNSTIFAGGWFLTLSTLTFGLILDKSSYGAPLEFIRCLLFFVTDKFIAQELQRFGTIVAITMTFNRAVFVASVIMWIGMVFYDTLRRIYKEKAT